MTEPSNSMNYSTSSSGDKSTSFQAEDDIISRRQSGSLESVEVGNKGIRTSLTALAPHKRPSNDLSDMTVDKLYFDDLPLCGREAEIATMLNGFEAFAKGESSHGRRLCLISGSSGIGKTKLAETLREPTSRSKGLFVKGKFDFNWRHQPYSGISAACAEICGSILRLQRREPNRAKAICEEIEATVADELALLVQAIPILAEIVDYSYLDGKGSCPTASISTNDSKNQVNFAFVRFMRVVSKHFFPLVIVLDDLQWADASSLDILEVLITDLQNPKIMVIALYRANEVDKTHIFYRYLEEFRNKSAKGDFEMMNIEIHELGLEAVDRVIQNLLRCDESRTLGLAEVCFKKTRGNPFYLLNFVTMLFEQQLLQYNFGTLSWMWNISEIESKTHASDNVVDLLYNRMNDLPENCLNILKVAACLGSTFEQRILQLVWEKMFHTSEQSSAENFASGVEVLLKCELLLRVTGRERHISKRLSWVHDKIQEAAIVLVSPSDRCVFRGRIADILSAELGEEELDSAIFVVVDLLNDSPLNPLDEQSCLNVSRLNLKACQMAVKLSAFESAAKYAGQGIAALPARSWDCDYQLCLQLYSIKAKAEGSLGNVAEMEQCCKVVLAQESHPIEDKFDVYHTLIDNMTNQSRIEEASELILGLLGKFKCRLPKNPVFIQLGILSNIIWIQGTMKSRKTRKIVSLDDNTRVNLMQLLDKLATCYYMMKDDRLALVIFRSLNWTIKYGNCAYSPPAFATTGMILTGVLGDIQGGSTYGEHALQLLDKLQSHSSAARTMFCVYSFLLPWTRQIRTSLKPLLQAYELGLRSGDTESATWAIWHWLVIKFIAGAPLESLQADLNLYQRQMNELKREQAVKITKVFRQMTLNLIGLNNSDDPTRISGEAFAEDELKVSRGDPFWHASVCIFHGVLWTYFGEHIRHADMLVEMGHNYLAKAHLASPNIMLDTYLKGLSCFAAARITRKRKYTKLAKVCHLKIKKWLNMGNPNVKHYDSFLDAEDMACQGKKYAAVKNYETTILLAARSGYQHDAALASERLGEFQLSVINNGDEAVYRLHEAKKYWRSWGAATKVQHLERLYSDIFSPQESMEIHTF